MTVLGICGGSGSGKSTVADMLADFGVCVLDADRIYHELVDAPSPCVDALVDAFGTQILSQDGALDRRALSRIVFFGDGAGQRLRRLNAITHAFVKERIRQRIAALARQGERFALIDAPLLFESGLHTDCAAVIGVIAEDAVRIERMVRRDGISQEEAERRIRAQLSNDELRRRCDFCVQNDADVQTLGNAVRALWEHINKFIL